MLTTIIAPVGNGKTLFLIRQALEKSVNKKLLVLNYELRIDDILKRMSACFEFHNMKAPKEISIVTLEYNSLQISELKSFLNKQLKKYDVIAADGLFVDYTKLDHEKTINSIKKIVLEVLAENPGKEIVTIAHANRLITLTKEHIEEVKKTIFSLELMPDEYKYFILRVEDQFYIIDHTLKTETIESSDNFLMGLNKK